MDKHYHWPDESRWQRIKWWLYVKRLRAGWWIADNILVGGRITKLEQEIEFLSDELHYMRHQIEDDIGYLEREIRDKDVIWN